MAWRNEARLVRSKSEKACCNKPHDSHSAVCDMWLSIVVL